MTTTQAGREAPDNSGQPPKNHHLHMARENFSPFIIAGVSIEILRRRKLSFRNPISSFPEGSNMTHQQDIPVVRIADDIDMPMVGLGTWRLRSATAYDAARTALDAGYRHFDTALLYGNEAALGRALADSGVDRSSVFITTKIPPGSVGRERDTIAVSLRALKTEYVDLWLLHWPPEGKAQPGVWHELLAICRGGLARAVGVSNHSIEMIDQLTAATGQAPALNQLPWAPSAHDSHLLSEHRRRGVVVTGYSPLNRSNLDDPVLGKIAASHQVTPAQVVLRWHLDHEIPVIPRSARLEHIVSNIDLFRFQLSVADRERIDGLAQTDEVAWKQS